MSKPLYFAMFISRCVACYVRTYSQEILLFKNAIVSIHVYRQAKNGIIDNFLWFFVTDKQKGKGPNMEPWARTLEVASVKLLEMIPTVTRYS